MNLTTEQQTILDHITTTDGLTLISSIAGSGKTTMLTAIAKAIPHTSGLYLAYNKSIATESLGKFPANTDCRTTHSLAYQATVKPFKLKIGNFNYRSITEKIRYEEKLLVLHHFRAFCLSSYLSFDDYAKTENVSTKLQPIAKKYLKAMETGAIECSFDFYLKLYHILLANGSVTYDDFDFVMLDEAGDLNEVTLEIFKLLPSKKKIAVGDPFQNIYAFNHTINCFELLKDDGKLFHMSQSFRVSDTIAPSIEKFCNNFLQEGFVFKGTNVDITDIQSRGYITRTNGALIAKMIDLNELGLPYGLVQPAEKIFKLPLMLCSLKYQGFITDSNYKHLQADIDDWYEDALLRNEYKTVLSYLQSLHDEDMQLSQAIKLINRYGKPKIMETYKKAYGHQNSNQSYLLTTAHSSKGLEFDEVTIANDLNDTIAEVALAIKSKLITIDQIEPLEKDALNLYYVAVTRAAKILNNAIHL